MALTGQLSDMSLAELIEFFCNQRKTGRLKIDYPRGHSVFFIKDGELVDAKVGALSGPEAVYFSLTLPNAAFDFSPEVEPTRRTIQESWTQVVLEGLRRLDEGLSPTEADAFGNFTPNDADMAAMFDQVERLGESARQSEEKRERDENKFERPAPEAAPLSMMVDSATSEGQGGRKKWVVAGVVASLVLACAAIAIPLARRTPKSAPAPDSNPAVTAEAPAPEAASQPAPEATAAAEQPAPVEAAAPATDEAAARREREEREERERRERRERKEEARREEAADSAKAAPTPAPVAAGPKSVRVAVTYDEAGRVTQASVAGTSPGAEAFGGTAVRIARGRRFPAGKAGSTVVTIPVN
jgi:TonB family protein